jgi:hypothetical protein
MSLTGFAKTGKLPRNSLRDRARPPDRRQAKSAALVKSRRPPGGTPRFGCAAWTEFSPPKGDGVKGRGRRPEGRVPVPDQVQQVGIKVELPGGDQVNNRNADALLQEGGTLCHKSLAIFRAVLVTGTDDLHRRHQDSSPALIVNQDLIGVLFAGSCYFLFSNQAR